jgi:autotransporter translocation and assembly factor TamB
VNYLKPSIKSFSEMELQNEIIASASGFWSGGGSAEQGGTVTYTSTNVDTSYSGGITVTPGGEGHVTAQVSSEDAKVNADYNATKSSYDITAEFKYNENVTLKTGVNSDGVANAVVNYNISDDLSLNGSVNTNGDANVGVNYNVTDNISLNGNVNSDGNYSVGVKYSKQF